jgi:hypothetical protein
VHEWVCISNINQVLKKNIFGFYSKKKYWVTLTEQPSTTYPDPADFSKSCSLASLQLLHVQTFDIITT